MELSEEFKEELNGYFNWKHTNISNLDQPVLIILNYSPSSESRPFSFAFNLTGQPKCWMSHDKVRKFDGKPPRRYEKYKDFNYKGQRLYAYSVRAFKNSTFSNIAEFKEICDRLYAHMDQGEGG